MYVRAGGNTANSSLQSFFPETADNPSRHAHPLLTAGKVDSEDAVLIPTHSPVGCPDELELLLCAAHIHVLA